MTLAQDAREDSRSYRRRSVLWIATVKLGAHQFSCQVWNLSLGGARLRIDVPLKEGTDVILSIPTRGDLPAQVAWCDNMTMGLKFTVDAEKVKETVGDRVQLQDELIGGPSS